MRYIIKYGVGFKNMHVYTVAQVARKLNISDRRVRKLLEEGRLKGKKIGRDWIVWKLDYILMKRGKDKKPRVGRNET